MTNQDFINEFEGCGVVPTNRSLPYGDPDREWKEDGKFRGKAISVYFRLTEAEDELAKASNGRDLIPWADRLYDAVKQDSGAEIYIPGL